MITKSFVTECLKRINQIKPVDSIFSDKSKFSTLPNYYNKAGLIYKQFHSSDGAMHAPIKLDDSESHITKLLFQAKSVEEIINKNNYNSIIELGCGFGFNSIYLAGIFPNKTFLAIDITEYNLKQAEDRAKKLGITNITFIQFDYSNSLHLYKADLIFGVETFCYSHDLNALFKNISGSLHINGKIIIYDGYERLTSQYKALTSDEIKAYRLFCYGYFIRRFQNLEEVYNAVIFNNLSIELEKDYTNEVLSNFKVMQKGSLTLIKFPVLTKILIKCKIISHVIFMQSLAGLFGAYFLERNFMSYYAFVLKKNAEEPNI